MLLKEQLSDKSATMDFKRDKTLIWFIKDFRSEKKHLSAFSVSFFGGGEGEIWIKGKVCILCVNHGDETTD